MTQEFKPGDRVKCVSSSATDSMPAVTAGDEYTIVDIDGAYVSVDGQQSYWWLNERFEHAEPEDATDAYVEPEPLKEGRWYQVWAKFVREDKLGALVVATPTGADGEGCRNTYAHPNAIVRTEDVPPWVKPVEEPMGLGAVVEARQPEFFGRTRFIRRHPSGGQPWQSPGGSHYDWDHLGEPTVLSEGYIDGGAS